MRLIVGFILLFGISMPVLPEADQQPPSAALLEFLGELPVDEDTWQLLEHHALQDVPSNKEVSNE